MKKVFPYENLSGAGLVTGRAVRLIRSVPNDGLEVDLVEIGATGRYLADPIDPGIYDAWDVTVPASPVDLDQKIDVLSSTLIAEQITFPGDGSKFLAGDETFKTIGIGNVTGLTAGLATKQDAIVEGTPRQAYFGNKVFRAIEAEDLPVGSIKDFVSDAIAFGVAPLGGQKNGKLLGYMSELIVGKSYALTFSATDAFISAINDMPGPLFSMRVDVMFDNVNDVRYRFLKMLEGKGVRPLGLAMTVLADGSTKVRHVTLYQEIPGSPTLYINSAQVWEPGEFIGSFYATGVISG